MLSIPHGTGLTGGPCIDRLSGRCEIAPRGGQLPNLGLSACRGRRAMTQPWPEPGSWLICRWSSCLSRTQARPRSLPAWPRDSASALAANVSCRQGPACGDYASADAASSHGVHPRTPPTRTSAKTAISNNPSLMLAPMRESGDDAPEQAGSSCARTSAPITKAGSKFLFYRASLPENRFAFFRRHSNALNDRAS